MREIEITNLHFRYNGRPVLAGLSATIHRGERVALLGPNGVGKTTLLKLIAGVLSPKQGAILLDGQEVQKTARRELGRRIGVVPQEFVVPFAFIVQEIVELGRTPHSRRLLGGSAINRLAVEEAMTVTHTIELSHRIFNELSGGERRRVVIAMALAQQPDLLLLDEPTQQLDIARQVEILELISELNDRQQLTVLAAVHDLNLAARYFERVMFLHEGSIVSDGTPQSVLHAGLLQRIYGGSIDVLRDGAPNSVPIVLPRVCGPRKAAEQTYGKEDAHANRVATS